MPTIPYTDWQLAGNDAAAIAWAAGRDDEVPLDVALVLATAEPVSNPATELWILPAIGEADAVMLASATATATTSATYLPTPTTFVGTIVRQRVAGLARGRVYRLRFWIGPAGNRRDQGVVIDVARA